MTLPAAATTPTTPEAVSRTTYDAVVVGAGIAGAVTANQLARAGYRVLILEAGPGGERSLREYDEYLARYFATAAKDNQSPYPVNPNASMPRSTDARKLTPGVPGTDGYLVQNGPLCTDTTYTRVVGGTTMHWEAKVLRMLPQDFRMHSLFGQAADWPICFAEMQRYYDMAEDEIGVSGDVAEQEADYGDGLGPPYPNGHVLPMRGLPLSYLDRMVGVGATPGAGIDGTSVRLDGRDYPLKVRPFPQGRNGIPHPDYRFGGRRGYTPVGAVSTTQVEMGGRCQGNNNCVPICPVQAKYHAGKTLAKAINTGNVDLLSRSVASRVHVDAAGRVTGVGFKTYRDPASPEHTTGTARGAIFVLATNAIETPRLMLASGLRGSSGLMGRNLMDHAYLLSWGLMPVPCGTMRGTNCTGGITALRGGLFRRAQAAFSVDIHNDGWGWSAGSPASDLLEMVDARNKFGAALRRDLADRITRQLLFAFMIEVLPSPSNRVSVDPAYTDRLGNMRPVVSFSVPEYTMRSVAYARQFARLMFQRLGAADHTAYDPADYGYVPYEGAGYAIRGGNHLAGTHIMGTSPAASVVNPDQRSWDHENLYLVGGGSMPTIGTANITNTIAALCFRSAEAIAGQLAKLGRRPRPQPTARPAEPANPEQPVTAR